MRKKLFLIILLALLVFPVNSSEGLDYWNQGLSKIKLMSALITNNYHQEVSLEKLEEAAIKGILRTLDPHSNFLDPRGFSRLTEEYKGKYYGLGIMIQKQGENLVVITPLEGTPAWRLGIQPGDIISHINGESTKPISSYEAMQRLRGKKGTSVTITIVREGLQEPFDLTIERAEIPLNSRKGQYENIPLIILIDRGSASASEIVSGAVRDNDRGLIIGERSWGKGLVQTVFPLAPNAAISLTTAKYFTPSGLSIQRDYSHLEDYLFSQNISQENREVGYTRRGRKVYGQGGIEPDLEVKFSYKPLTARMLLRGLFFRYAHKLVKGETGLGRDPAWKNQTFDIDFQADDRVIQDFQTYLESVKFEYEAEEFINSLDQIKRELEREIASALFGLEEGIKVYRLSDPVVLKAIEMMPEAEKLVE
ncbi:MAG: hypothetical protein B5M54_10450 [Candidatus Aminicenantes bacterium 4484_214]|nr:MAG: hypothetical protein B5M54_10450 [Candidatus Aminicenantes bacterium 4484_214]